MKKHFLILPALLFTAALFAQSFQHAYGTKKEEVLESGVIAVSPAGKLMTGYTDSIQPVYSVVVTRTTANGTIGMGQFNNGYTLMRDSNKLSAQGRRVVQLDDGKLAVWGDYSDSSRTFSTNFFLLVLDQNGAAQLVVSYAMSKPVAEVRATSMIESTSTRGLLLVCGYVVDSSGATLPVIMKLRVLNGTPVWSACYRAAENARWTAQDLEESPYLPADSVPDIAVVGLYADSASGASDGCFFSVSSATGLRTGKLFRYGTANENEELRAITIANSPTGGKGFAVCGAVNNSDTMPGSICTWAMKLLPSGAIVWNTKADYSTAGKHDFGTDIIERVNTTPAYEYYVSGYVQGGVFGEYDALVYKLNNTGAKTANGQFTYGGKGNDRALQLGQEAGGLSVFGYTADSLPALGKTDFYLVKAYFSGHSPCHTDLRNFSTWAGPDLRDSLVFDTLNRADTSNLGCRTFALRNVNICFANAVMGGSNTRLFAAESGPAFSVPFPNPVPAESPVVTLPLAGDESGEVAIELWNTIGQCCLRRTIATKEGKTEVSVALDVVPGIYLLVVRREGSVQEYKVVVR